MLREQFPQWADLPLRRVTSTGTDNAVFRLGDTLGVRVPKVVWPVAAIEHEHRWLPMVAERVPLEVPVPVGLGQPSGDYPWPWTVYPWLTGDNPRMGCAPDGLVDDLAAFRSALQAAPTVDAPVAERGGDVLARAEQNIAALSTLIEIGETATSIADLSSVWDEIASAQDYSGPAEWIHGDLTPGNILIRHWLRGRGWAMTMSLAALPYYRVSNPPLAAMARHVLRELVNDRE